MAQITDQGAIPTTLEDYQELFRAAFRAVFGEEIDLDPSSPEGQWVDNIAFSMSQSDDAIISVAGTLNIFRAFKAQLEGQAALLGIGINQAESTKVGITLGGTPGAPIPARSRVRDSVTQEEYSLDEDVELGGTGTAESTMTALNTGPIECKAGDLTELIDVVPGWETAINAADGAIGRDKESDSEYRQRYFRELFRNALSVLDAIKAGVSEVDNVTEVEGVENDTKDSRVFEGVTVGPNAIALVVEGGLDQEIADAIILKKTGGTPTQGTTSVPNPPSADINFYRPDYISIEVTIETTPGPDFPANGTQLLKERTFAYINGGQDFIEEEEGNFQLDGMKISEDLEKTRLFTPINSIPGHIVTNLELEDKASPGDVSSITANLNQKIRFESIDDINIVTP